MEMKISELAKACDVNKETVRYYERKGLIAGPPETNQGIEYIQRKQQIGTVY